MKKGGSSGLTPWRFEICLVSLSGHQPFDIISSGGAMECNHSRIDVPVLPLWHGLLDVQGVG